MNRVIVTLVLLVGIFVVGCVSREENSHVSQPYISQAEPILKGEHKLRKMIQQTGTNSEISGSFFLCIGDLYGSTKTIVSVKFAWEMNDGTYAISSLPLEKIRVKIDENATIPTIKFRWREWNNSTTPQTQELMDNNILYAVITTKSNDWPIQVNFPLNSQ